MRIRFAVIGLGHIGRRHASLIAAHPEAELVAVCDRLPPDRLTWPPEPTPRPPHYGSLAELVAGADFAVACVCTPNGFHANQAIALLAAGKHVVVEKPLALTVADCDRIAAAARRYGRRVFGVMQNRYSPASGWLRDLLRDRALGRILQVHLDCFWNRDHRYYRTADGGAHPWHGDPELDGGVLFTQFAHFVDLLCWTCGPVRVTDAHLVNQRHAEFHPFADTGTVRLRLIDDALGTLNFSTVVWDRNFESTFTVIGETGTVKLGGQYMNEVRYCHVRGLTAPSLPVTPPANHYGGYRGSAANHHFVIDNVIDTLRGRAAVATTVAEGREVVRVITAIHRAAASEPDQ